MVGQPCVRLVVAFELLFGAALHPTAHPLLHLQTLEISLDEHERFAVGDVLAVDGVEITLAKAEIVNRIEHIRLAAAVVPEETIHLRTEGHVGP